MTYVYANNSEGGVLVYKKPKTALKITQNRKNRERFWSQPKTEYKTIITEDLFSWIFKTLL